MSSNTAYQDKPISLRGAYTVRAFRPGVIPGLLARGLSLPVAARVAEPVFSTSTPNLVVTAGKALAAGLLAGDLATGITYHAFGTGSAAPAPGDTTLATEAGRKAWSLIERTSALVTFSVFYLASECAASIQEVGAFGGAGASSTPGSGTLFSRALLAYDNSLGAVDLTFEYALTVG